MLVYEYTHISILRRYVCGGMYGRSTCPELESGRPQVVRPARLAILCVSYYNTWRQKSESTFFHSVYYIALISSVETFTILRSPCVEFSLFAVPKKIGVRNKKHVGADVVL